MSEVPPKLGKYDIVRALGEGAMGTVYEAVDSVIERTVAIKTIRKSGFDAEEAAEHSRRFLIEAKASAKLNHPHIVGLYDHGDEAGLAYIVMELVQGRELQHYFDEKFVFAPGDVVRLMGELLDALGYSHRRGVVHRDVKPANIFITDTGAVKLGDFGIARIESSQKTRVDTVVGTPSYMSPEQIRGETADARSDLYAAGVVLYQFLTGERPYTGNMLAMAMKVLNEPVRPPSAIKPDISPQLEAVVMRALAKDAKDRFQTAAEFWQALAGAVGLVLTPSPSLGALSGAGPSTDERTRIGIGESEFGRTAGPSQAPAATMPGGVSAPFPPVLPVSVDADPPRPAPPEGRSMVIGGAALAALGLGMAAWWFMNKGAGPVANSPLPTASEPAAATVLPAASQATAAVGNAASSVSGGAADTFPGAAPASSPASAGAIPASPAPPSPASAPASADPTPNGASAAQKRPVREARTPPPRPAGAPIQAVAPPAASPIVKAARPARCSDILQKASLEPLSAEEAAFLRRECR